MASRSKRFRMSRASRREGTTCRSSSNHCREPSPSPWDSLLPLDAAALTSVSPMPRASVSKTNSCRAASRKRRDTSAKAGRSRRSKNVATCAWGTQTRQQEPTRRQAPGCLKRQLRRRELALPQPARLGAAHMDQTRRRDCLVHQAGGGGGGCASVAMASIDSLHGVSSPVRSAASGTHAHAHAHAHVVQSITSLLSRRTAMSTGPASGKKRARNASAYSTSAGCFAITWSLALLGKGVFSRLSRAANSVQS